MVCQKMIDTLVVMDHFGHITLFPEAEKNCSLKKHVPAGTYSIISNLKSPDKWYRAEQDHSLIKTCHYTVE